MQEMKLVDALRLIRDGVRYSDVGLCANVRCKARDAFPDYPLRWRTWERKLEELFPEYLAYSGDPNYPVFGGRSEYLSAKDKFSDKTEHGRARLALLDWLIERLEADKFGY